MKNALILFGKLCREEDTNRKIYREFWNLEHYKKYVIDEYDTDVFVHSWSYQYSDKIINILKPKKYKLENIENVHFFDENEDKDIDYFNKRFNKMKYHYYSRYSAFNLLEEYIKESGEKYEFIVLASIDILLFKKIDFEKLNNKYIYVPFFNTEYGGGKLSVRRNNRKYLDLHYPFKDSEIIYNNINKGKIKKNEVMNNFSLNSILMTGYLNENIRCSRAPESIGLLDCFYISDYENIKCIIECFNYLDDFYNQYKYDWKKTPGPHGFIFQYLIKKKKVSLINYYLYNHIDLIKGTQLIMNQYRCLMNKSFMSKNYKKYEDTENNIVSITDYLPIINLMS
tara:strand:+ start:3218 stop:4237 length:1020 start_codon:yes stop_codon:yes gene_type:complete